MNVHEEKINSTLVEIENILKQESDIESFFITATSSKGATLLSCKGDEIDALISDALEILCVQDLNKAMATVTKLLVRIGSWYSLYHDKKRTLH